jgi:transposase
VLLVGIDWAERHHDVCVMATDGSVLARERIADGVVGLARLHELIASWVAEPAEVVVGIETDRGLLVGALVAAGYQVVAVNPLAAQSLSGAPHHLGGQVRPRGCADAGRSGPHRPPPSPPGGR